MMGIKDVKQEPEESIECLWCSEIFKDSSDFEEHKKSQCGNEVKSHFSY